MDGGSAEEGAEGRGGGGQEGCGPRGNIFTLPSSSSSSFALCLPLCSFLLSPSQKSPCRYPLPPPSPPRPCTRVFSIAIGTRRTPNENLSIAMRPVGGFNLICHSVVAVDPTEGRNSRWTLVKRTASEHFQWTKGRSGGVGKGKGKGNWRTGYAES